jgi:DNA-binding transcriptional LysR family regulator
MVLMIWIGKIDRETEKRNMELRHLKTFKVVADMGGFTRAAEALGYAQSTITSHIQALERELGRPLFDRLGKTVVLTSAGERLYEYAAQILRLSQAAESAVTDDSQPAGKFMIGAPALTVYRLPAILREYKERYPDVQIVLVPSQCWEMSPKLRAGELDVAFLLAPPAEEPDLHVGNAVGRTDVVDRLTPAPSERPGMHPSRGLDPRNPVENGKRMQLSPLF